MPTSKAMLPQFVVLCFGLCSSIGSSAAGPDPGVNVTVTNRASSPVPVAVTNPVQVTVTNPASVQAVMLSNLPVRFEPSGVDIFGISLIPLDAVPTGQVLIVSYASAVGRANNTAEVISAAECEISLRHIVGGDILEFRSVALPVRPSGLGSAMASQAMYLPVRSGEAVSARCSAAGNGGIPIPSSGASWEVVLAGYFTDAK
jgi:hypothetical protein